MATPVGQPSNPGKSGSSEWPERYEMKSEAACQTIDNGSFSGTFNDSSLTDLFTSFTEMKMSLQKVEAQNRKLKESRSQLLTQLETSEKCSVAYKEKFNKTTEQLSFVFQENCRLNEENARLKIENQNLVKQIELHKKKCATQVELLSKQQYDFCDNCPKRRAGIAAPPNLEFRADLSRSMPDDLKQSGSTPVNSPAVKKLKGLEKRHSSPQFFPNNESVEEISEKLLAQLMQEKRELEQQYNQMVEIQRVSDARSSTPLISDFSLLDAEIPEEEEEELIKLVEVCSRHMFDVKQNIVFMNCTLKYLLHYTAILRKQEVDESKTNAINAATKQATTKQPESKSFSSAPRTLEDSLESAVVAPCLDRKESPSKSVPPLHRHIMEDKTPWNSVHPPPLCPLPNSNRVAQPIVRPSNIVCNPRPQSQEQDWNKPAPEYVPVSKDILSEQRRTWPQAAVYGGGVGILPKRPTETTSAFENSSTPLIQRSESAEANAGSPPPSLGLTPDSLLPSSLLHCDGVSFSRSPEHSSKEEDRICPMCAAVFPCPVPQDQFETHVVNHFELEEFELLNI